MSADGVVTTIVQKSGQPDFSETPVDQSLVIDLGLEKIDDNEALFEAAQASFQRAARSLVESGVRFKQLKARLEHGRFIAFLEDRGFAKQRAHEAMRAAEVVALLPTEERHAILSAPPSKLVLLCRLPDKNVKLLAVSDEFDQVIELTDRELRQWIKDRTRDVRQAKASIAEQNARAQIGPADELPPPPKPEPADLIIARDELLCGAVNARTELERAKAFTAQMLHCEDDEFAAARIETVDAACKIVSAIREDAEALIDMLKARFAATSAFPGTGPDHARVAAHVDAAQRLADQSANVTLLQRAKARNRVHGWRGAPPTDVKAVSRQAARLMSPQESGEAM